MKSLHVSCCGQLTSVLVASDAMEGSLLVAQPAGPLYTVPSALPRPFLLSFCFPPFTECLLCTTHYFRFWRSKMSVY